MSYLDYSKVDRVSLPNLKEGLQKYISQRFDYFQNQKYISQRFDCFQNEKTDAFFFVAKDRFGVSEAIHEVMYDNDFVNFDIPFRKEKAIESLFKSGFLVSPMLYVKDVKVEDDLLKGMVHYFVVGELVQRHDVASKYSKFIIYPIYRGKDDLTNRYMFIPNGYRVKDPDYDFNDFLYSTMLEKI